MHCHIIANNIIDIFETLGTAFKHVAQLHSNISHNNVLHGLLEFIDKNRNSENSKILKKGKHRRHQRELGNGNGSNNFARTL